MSGLKIFIAPYLKFQLLILSLVALTELYIIILSFFTETLSLSSSQVLYEPDNRVDGRVSTYIGHTSYCFSSLSDINPSLPRVY